MKNNLKIVNIVMFGKIPLKRRINTDIQNKLIKIGWFSPREDNILLSKVFEIRDPNELDNKGKQKNPYATIWCGGTIGIVGLKTKKEGDLIYDQVIQDIKRISRKLL